jgi:hypothetical protein
MRLAWLLALTGCTVSASVDDGGPVVYEAVLVPTGLLRMGIGRSQGDDCAWIGLAAPREDSAFARVLLPTDWAVEHVYARADGTCGALAPSDGRIDAVDASGRIQFFGSDPWAPETVEVNVAVEFPDDEVLFEVADLVVDAG